MFFITAAVGVVVGLFSGLLGVGGGTIMVPLFRLALGMSPVGSTATSLFTIIPTSVSGAVQHIRGKTCVPRLGLALGVGGACTSPLGVWLAQQSPGWLVMMAAALVIGYSAFTMLRKALSAPKVGAASEGVAGAGEPAPDDPAAPSFTGRQRAEAALIGAVSEGAAGAGEPAPDGFASPSFTGRQLAKAALIGAAAGVASGYVGLGGGFLMVPLMLSLLNMPMKLTSGTSLVAVMILATPATVMQCALGNVDYLAGIAMACGTIPGALVGARLVKRVPERALRFAFAAFLGVAAILLVVKELGAF